MTTVSEHILWTDHETNLKAYLGVSGSTEDTNLQLWLKAATTQADEYMEYDFVDSAGGDIDPPDDVHCGVYEFVRALRQAIQRPIGVKSVKTGALAETYAGESHFLAAQKAARPFWRTYKKYRSLDGPGD